MDCNSKEQDSGTQHRTEDNTDEGYFHIDTLYWTVSLLFSVFVLFSLSIHVNLQFCLHCLFMISKHFSEVDTSKTSQTRMK